MEMKTTHLQAKEIFKAGDINKAWEIAKKDEGLLPEITKEKWIKWMLTKI